MEANRLRAIYKILFRGVCSDNIIGKEKMDQRADKVVIAALKNWVIFFWALGILLTDKDSMFTGPTSPQFCNGGITLRTVIPGRWMPDTALIVFFEIP